MWAAARAAQRLVRMVSIARGDSIVLQSIHLDAAVLVPVHELSRFLLRYMYMYACRSCYMYPP